MSIKPSDTRAQRAQRRTRGGFSLMELLVSISMLSIGALALASLSAVVMRNVNGAAQQTIAATIAQSRFEQLRGLPCTQLESGSADTRGMDESWKVIPETRSVTVVLTISYDDGRRNRLNIHETIIPCPALVL
jgi:prepilin-type N-terminal cleavage/methylation domain-containing protein